MPSVIFDKPINKFRVWFLPSVFLSLLLYMSLFTAKCSSGDIIHPKNVILITLDTQRSDSIGAYCPDNARTPNIDSIAENGILFENCYSPIPITLPAHASLFYSLAPHELNLYNNGQVFRNEKKLVSLAQKFKIKGKRTAGFVSLGVLKSKFRLNDGFDQYIDDHPEQRWYLRAEEINERAFPWIDENHNNPFFLWLHYSDPHDPYAPPSVPPDVKIFFNGRHYKDLCFQHEEHLFLPFLLEKGKNTIEFIVVNPYPDLRDEFRVSLNDVGYNGIPDFRIEYEDMNVVQRNSRTSLLIKESGLIIIDNPEKETSFLLDATGVIYLLPDEKIDGYRKEVEYLDQQIGRLVAKLEQQALLTNTMIVLLGDHGEGLGGHRTRLGEPHFGHIHFLYNEYLKIPLIISNPLLKEKGLKKKDPATILDIAPTILGMMGWPKLSFHKGIDLLNKKNDRKRYILGETYRPESTKDRFSVIAYPWHLIFSPADSGYKLYNLANDSEEKENIYEKEKLNPDIVEMQKKLKATAVQILLRKKDVKLDADSLEMLRSLGYIE
ncbi:MAG: sulfatase [Candidatus Aminicenantes bacterium]|nr:sulfatase [Candidatus Aminicenantes bacterium]